MGLFSLNSAESVTRAHFRSESQKSFAMQNVPRSIRNWQKLNCLLPRCSRNFQTSANRCQEEQSFVLEDGKVLVQTGASQNAVCFWPESATYDTCDICQRSVPGRGMLGVYPAGMKLCSWCEGAEWQINICETCVSNMFKTLRSNKVK